MTRRWLSAADVEIDDTTGAVLVKVGDVDLKVDMAQTDVAAIVAGIAGEAPKTLADLAANTSRLTLLAGPSLVTVDATEYGSDLATLLGTPLQDDLKRLVLQPLSPGIQWAADSASADSCPLASGGDDQPIDKAAADRLRFFAASPTAMSVRQYG